MSEEPEERNLMPLTTAEIYTKLGVEEGQLLYQPARILDEDGSLQGYSATLPPWADGEEALTRHGEVLYAFTNAENTQWVAMKANWNHFDLTHPRRSLIARVEGIHDVPGECGLCDRDKRRQLGSTLGTLEPGTFGYQVMSRKGKGAR